MKKILLSLAILLGGAFTLIQAGMLGAGEKAQVTAQAAGAVNEVTEADPANGSFVSELPTAVIITFGNTSDLKLDMGDAGSWDEIISVTVDGKPASNIITNMRVSGKNLTIQISRSASIASGVVEFKSNAGFFTEGGEPFMFTYGFTVGTNPEAFKLTASNPENGGTVAACPESISLTFGNATSVALSSDEAPIKAFDDDVEVEGGIIQNTRVTGNEITFSIGRNVIGSLNGVIRLEFGEGALLADGKPMPAFTYTFTIDPNAAGTTGTTFTPESGSVVKSLKEIVINTQENIVSQCDADMRATLTNTTTGESVSTAYPVEAEGNRIVFSFKEQTTPGEYTLDVPAGMFWAGTAGTEDVGNSPAYKANWTIPAPLQNVVPMAEVMEGIYPNHSDMPAEEYWEGGFIYVNLSIKGTAKVSATPMGKITMTNGTTEWEADIQAMDDGEVTTFYLTFYTPKDESDPAPGKYTLNIPEGYFVVDGRPVGAYTDSWTIAQKPVDYKFSWTPEPGELSLTGTTGVANNKWINVKLAGGESDIIKVSKSGLQCKLIYDETQETVAVFDADDQDVQIQRGQYIFNIRNAATDAANKNGIDLNGKYTLQIPEGFFKVAGGAPVKAAEFSWTIVDGVDPNVAQNYTYSPEDGSYDVFPTVTLTYENCTHIELNADAVAVVYLTTVEIGRCRVTTDGVNKVTFTPTRDIRNQPPSEYSVYILSIPADIYNLTINDKVVSNQSVELRNKYRINEPTPKPLSLTPANNSTVKPSDMQVLEWKTSEVITPDPIQYARLYLVTDGVRGEEPVTSYRIERTSDPASTDGTTGTFTRTGKTADEPLAEGVYELVIPAKSYRAVIEGASRNSKEQVVRYTVTADAPELLSYVTVPADGEEVEEEIEDLFVTIDGAKEVEVLSPLTLTNGETTYQVVGVAAGNEVDYMITTQEITPGEWTATVPANGLKVDGKEYAQIITWKFTKKGEVVAEMTKPASDPAEGDVASDALENIILTAANDAKITALGEEGSYLITLAPVNNGIAGISVRIYSAAINEQGQLLLTAEGTDNAPLGLGDYRLSIMANSFFIGEQGNPAFEYDFKVTTLGVDSIFDGESSFNVYTATGITVICNGNADDLKALAPGLYIVNGKKVLIRK